MPADGIVLHGYSAVDESMLTGESVPVNKKPGDKAFGSTVNNNGTLRVKLFGVGGNTALAQIIKLVEDAQASKAPVQEYAVSFGFL